MDAVGWSPQPVPPRSSPYYALKSVAFTKVSSQVSKPGGGNSGHRHTGGGLLPRLVGKVPPADSGDGRVARVVSPCDQDGGINPANERVGADEALVRLLAKRDAAFLEFQRVEEQLRRAREGLSRETRAHVTADSQTKELLERVRCLGSNLQSQLGHIRSQQLHLKDLRTQAKDLERLHSSMGNSRSEKTARLSAPTSGVESEIQPKGKLPGPQAAKFSSSTTPQVVAADVDTSGWVPTVNAAERPAACVHHALPDSRAALAAGSQPASCVDATLEGLLAEMQQVKDAFTGALNAGHQTRMANGVQKQLLSGDGPQHSRHDKGEEEDEEAEIELLRPNGIPIARLRHPTGSEAFVDLRDGVIYLWLLADVGVATAGNMLSMWPEMLGGSSTPQWRVTLLEDSNNEPSVTMSCGGDDATWWLVCKKMTLGSTWWCEEVSVENLSSCRASFNVSEKPSTALGLERPLRNLVHLNGAREFVPRRSRAATMEWPLSTTLMPGESWSAKQYWAAPDHGILP